MHQHIVGASFTLGERGPPGLWSGPTYRVFALGDEHPRGNEKLLWKRQLCLLYLFMCLLIYHLYSVYPLERI